MLSPGGLSQGDQGGSEGLSIPLAQEQLLQWLAQRLHFHGESPLVTSLLGELSPSPRPPFIPPLLFGSTLHPGWSWEEEG